MALADSGAVSGATARSTTIAFRKLLSLGAKFHRACALAEGAPRGMLDCSPSFEADDGARWSIELWVDAVATVKTRCGHPSPQSDELLERMIRANAFVGFNDWHAALWYAHDKTTEALRLIAMRMPPHEGWMCPKRGFRPRLRSPLMTCIRGPKPRVLAVTWRLLQAASDEYLNRTFARPRNDGSGRFEVDSVMRSLVEEGEWDLLVGLMQRMPGIDFDVVHLSRGFAERLSESVPGYAWSPGYFGTYKADHILALGETQTRQHYQLLIELRLPAALKDALPIPGVVAIVCAYAQRMPISPNIITSTTQL